MSASVVVGSGVRFTQALSTSACTPPQKGRVCLSHRACSSSSIALPVRRRPQELLGCVAGQTSSQGVARAVCPKALCRHLKPQRIQKGAIVGTSDQRAVFASSIPLTSSYAYGGGLAHHFLRHEPRLPYRPSDAPPITAARRDRRRAPWSKDQGKGERGSSFAALALFGLALPALFGGAALATAIPIATVALGFAAFVTMASLTATFALIAPLLIFIIPVFGFPLGLFFGLFGGFGGGLRTLVDFGLTLAITGNFVSALLNRAKRKQAEDAEEEKELPLGEQIKRMALAEVEKGLRDIRAAQYGVPQQKKQKKNNKIAEESLEEVAVKEAKEAQGALREVASPSWWAPTALSLVPGLNGLAWFAAAEAFPTAVQGARQKSFQRNALTYGAPALLYLLAAPFQGVSLMGFMRGEAWWLSLVFGLVHLQLERKDMVGEARARAQETALPEPDELARATQELLEFDRQLSSVAWSSERPSKWTEANVTEWLKDEGLQRLVGTFSEHHIDGSVLLTLQGEELRDELGISSLGDRKKVLAAIARLQTRELGWDTRVVQELDA